MKKNIAVSLSALLIILLLAACGVDKTKPGKAATLTGDPVAGEQVYVTYCKVCHGEGGKGGINNPGSEDGQFPALVPIDEEFSTQASMDVPIEHGSTPEGDTTAKKMPAFGDDGTLKPQQIADVIAYLLQQNKK